MSRLFFIASIAVAFLCAGRPCGAQPIDSSTAIMDEGQWQNTASVAVNRKDPSRIAVASYDDYAWNKNLGEPVYVTNDGGRSWNTERLPRIFGWAAFGNPSLASDAEGRFYCAYTVFRGFSDNPTLAIAVAMSSDGYHWKNVMMTNDTTAGGNGDQNDEANLAVDLAPHSRHYDRIYAVWPHYDTVALNNGLLLTWSDDHGKTWSAPNAVRSGFDGPSDVHSAGAWFVEGPKSPQIRIGPHGELCILYTIFGERRYEMAVSTDGGVTFQNHNVAAFREYPNVMLKTPFFTDTIPGLKGFTDTIRKFNGNRGGMGAEAFASFAIDDNNRLEVAYATWDSVHQCAELFTKQSDDFGASWNDSIQIGTDHAPYTDRFFPSVSYDDATHAMSLNYYSSELDTNNVATTVFRNRMREGTWSPGGALDGHTFNPLQCTSNFETSVGRYIGSDEYAGTFAAAWAIARRGVIEITPETDGRSDIIIYVERVGSANVLPMKLNTDRLYLSAPFPSPVANGRTDINFVTPREQNIRIELVDASGKMRQRLSEARRETGSYLESLDLSSIPNGEYLLILRSESETLSSKLVIGR